MVMRKWQKTTVVAITKVVGDSLLRKVGTTTSCLIVNDEPLLLLEDLDEYQDQGPTLCLKVSM